jgi:predicted peroxiredoxin
MGLSLTTGLENPEHVSVAFLVAVGAAESGRPALMFLAKEAVRLVTNGRFECVLGPRSLSSAAMKFRSLRGHFGGQNAASAG